MYEYSVEHNEKLTIFSMHDEEHAVCKPYFPASVFKGFASKKILFVVNAWKQGIASRVVILSHVNLLFPGYLIKLFSPKTKLILIAHGIEVWQPLSRFRKRMLQKADLILPVSHFTKEKMKALFDLAEKKFVVINNCLDPFLPLPENEDNRTEWRTKYGIGEQGIVLMTLSRLSAKEKNKGYDRILSAIKKLQPEFPQLKYLFVGKYDNDEKTRLDVLIQSLGIDGSVIFTGFVEDRDLASYYNMADVYIMPSEKEGFGISFIEAMYYNLPVIAGNRDGTTDALLNGQLGVLIDPRIEEQIVNAIRKVISNIKAFMPGHELLESNFGYPVYKKKWAQVLDRIK